MNFIKAQKQIFDNIVAGDRVCGYWIDDDRFFVTGDSYHGFIFPKETIAFDVKRVNMLTKKLFDFNSAVPKNEAKETNNFKLIDRKRMYRAFKHVDGRDIYVSVNFLKHFQNATYYQAKENEALLVFEEIRGKKFPVGVVLPIRYSPAMDKV